MLARNACKFLSGHTSALAGRKSLLNTNLRRTPQLPNHEPLTQWQPHRGIQQKYKVSQSVKVSPKQTIWSKLFGKYLLATNIISSGLLMVIGDLAAQEIEYRRRIVKHVTFDIQVQRYDLRRIWRMFVVGALQGPLHHYVYNWMERVMPVPNLRNTLQKILIDQLFMSPACIFIFFYSACYLEHKSVEETNRELIQKFPFIYLIDWLLWPGAQYLNFRYLDIKYRVMFVNVCTALYNIFMSYVKHDYNSFCE